MMIIWCVVALAALGGLYFAIRARAIRGRKYPEISSVVSAELIHRADQQNRWALRGDPRGVYGAKGAELMRSVSPAPNVDTELDRATAYPRTAAVACTPENLATLLAEKLPCWLCDGQHPYPGARPMGGVEPTDPRQYRKGSARGGCRVPAAGMRVGAKATLPNGS